MAEASLARRCARALSFRNISALYIFIGLFVVFAVWVPDTFLTASVWRSLLAQNAITAIVAIGLVVPLAAGAFDLAVGTEVGMGAIIVAWLLAKQGVPLILALLLTLITGAVIGLVSGLLITRAHVDSFIATLGMSSVLTAMVAWASGSQQILNLGNSFQEIATGQFLGITYPVWIMLAAAAVLLYFLEGTPVGRWVYATGGNANAARLAGVRTSTVILGSLVVSGVIASFAGLLVSSQLATGDPTVGPSYLLSAFAAVFLGSTQFRGGRFNILGTVVAVYVLATGVKGLQLAGAPVWIPDLFNGAALLLAVGLANYQGTSLRAMAIRRMLRREGQSTDAGATDTAGVTGRPAAESCDVAADLVSGATAAVRDAPSPS
jgi:ribose transport system permease protein